jgi:hypothetical protein
MTDEFAAASEAASAARNTGAAPATDHLTGNNSGYDPLFGGERRPSILNKTHGVGATVTGIIADVPYDKQSRFYKANGGMGDLKFWGKEGKPTKDAIGADGKPNRPVMDTVVPIDTEYRLTAAELAEKEMDSDSGARSWSVGGGEELAAFRKAIRAARLSSRDQLVGKRITITRTGKRPAGDFEAWLYDVKITEA